MPISFTLLERVAHAFTSAHPPVLPLAQPLPAPGARTLESVAYKGFALRPGDYVHLSPATEDALKAGGRAGRPIVGRVVGCWRDDTDVGGVSVQWYLRADEVHLAPDGDDAARGRDRGQGRADRRPLSSPYLCPFANDGIDKKTNHLLADVLEKVAYQHVSSAPAWYPGWPLHVFRYRYDAVRVGVCRIPRADWFSSESEAPAEKLDLFCSAWARSRGGRASSWTERHFERDFTTGEVLWFPGPPTHVARAPPPRHRLEYLHFLARKYHPQPELEPKPVPMNGHPNGGTGAANGGIGAGGDDPMAGDGGVVAEKDVEMGSEPPTKRRKLAVEERYVSASERIRKVLSAVGDA
ncbi:hypothetical protein B0H17DRAFT_1184905 [Mycena rosella]|uniref:BAH domain-containing protein n=1 Tax=Mycena rosella TaxID=1033263 RepID=A0AAD7G7J2_MYCRO|nr:hypothetical protein B0H17DRAFT_1184905 [Mycena rosella]